VLKQSFCSSSMRRFSSIWRSIPGSVSKAPHAPDFHAAAECLGLSAKLNRKPWVVLSDAREALERSLDLETDSLLIGLTDWLESILSVPVAVGLAHVSGNVYFGPEMRCGRMHLLPEQVLIANLYSHGEIGLDALATHQIPSKGSDSLLREVATFKKMRWVNMETAESAEAVLSTKGPREIELRSIARPVRKSVLNRHKLVSDLSEQSSQEKSGRCLQHKNFVHYDLHGDTIDEMLVSCAHIAAKRCYSPYRDKSLAGCAVLTKAGGLFAGSFIDTVCSTGQISPLQAALVSLGANGVGSDQVARAVWVSSRDFADGQALFSEDMDLLREVSPTAIFSLDQISVE